MSTSKKSNRGYMAWVAACAAMGVVTGLPGQAHATTYTWNSTTGGNWDDTSAAGWNTAGYPSASGDTATISKDITADQALHIDVNNATIAALTFGDSTLTGGAYNNWTIDDGGAGNLLTTNNGASSATITSNNGNNVISAAIALSTAAPTVSSIQSTANGTVFNVSGGSLTLSGGFSNTAGGYSVNSGLVIVSGAALNTGDIIVRSELRIAGANSLGSGNLEIIGGDFQSSDNVLGASGFTRSYNTASPVSAGTFEFGSSGSGFSAYGGNLTLNIGGSGAAFDWATLVGSGNKIVFGSATANGTVNWKNPVLLTSATSGAQSQYIMTIAGVGSVPEVDVQGAIEETSGSAGSIIIGPSAGSAANYGTVVFSAANTYMGTTTIAFGTLRINNVNALPNGNLILGISTGTTRGVLESNDSFGAFTRSLGTGNNQVQWGVRSNDTTGGFSAYGGNFTINIGGNATPSTLTWGQTSFIGTTAGQQLVFGSRLADSTVLWENPIAISGANGATIDVVKGVGTTPEVDMQGVISGTNANGLIKAGTGTLLLSAANTYTGSTGANAGVIQLGNALALQNSSVSIGTANGIGFSSGIGTFTFGGLTGSSNLALTDSANAAVTLQVGNNSASTTYAGIMSGAGGLTKIGGGTLTLTGANAYTGTTTINGGLIQLDFSTASTANNILSSTSALTMSNSGILAIKGKASTVSSQTLGNLTLNAGQSQISYTTASASGLTLSLGNTWTRNANSTLYLNLTATSGVTLSSQPITSAASQSSTSTILPYVAAYDGALGGYGFATVVNNNVVRYSSSVTFVANGTSAANTNYQTASGGTYTLTNSESINSLLMMGSTAPTLYLGGKTLTISSGGLFVYGTNNNGVSINGGVSGNSSTGGQLGANNAELIIHNYTGQSAMTIGTNATLTGGTGSLTYDTNPYAPKTLVINSANTFTGATTINNGIIQLGNSLALQASPVAIWAASGLKFSAGLGSATIGGLNGTGTFALSDLSGTPLAVNLTLGGTAASTYSYSGAITGLGGLTQSNLATQILQGASTYGGGTTVTSGTLIADNNAALSTTAANVTGGTLQIATGRTITNNITLNGSGATLLVNGTTQTGSLTLTAGTVAGTGTISQAVTIAAGMHLAPGNNGIGTLTTGALALDSASQLDYDLGPSNTGDLVAVIGNLTLNGQLNLSGSFGPGTYELMTYTGTLTNPGSFNVTLPSYATGSIDTSTNGAVYLDLTAVPEPTSMGLLGLATVGILRRRRRVQTA